jgi:hypothetical protein
MSELKKIKDNQLTQIKELQLKINASLMDLGYLESKKFEVMSIHNQNIMNMENLKKDLEAEYGAININLEDGSYTEQEITK